MPGHTCMKSGMDAATSTTPATMETGFMMRSATDGAKRRIATPTATGIRMPMSTMVASAVAGTRIGTPNHRARIHNVTGIATSATIDAVTSRLIVYDTLPPLLNILAGKNGGTGDMASATSATLIAGWSENTSAIQTASIGMTMFIEKIERASNPGCRARNVVSLGRALRLALMTVSAKLTWSASMISVAELMAAGYGERDAGNIGRWSAPGSTSHGEAPG